MSKVVFLLEHEEILIEEVRENSVLYDSADLKHKDIFLKDDIWKEIGLKIGNLVSSLNYFHINILLFYFGTAWYKMLIKNKHFIGYLARLG